MILQWKKKYKLNVSFSSRNICIFILDFFFFFFKCRSVVDLHGSGVYFRVWLCVVANKCWMFCWFFVFFSFISLPEEHQRKLFHFGEVLGSLHMEEKSNCDLPLFLLHFFFLLTLLLKYMLICLPGAKEKKKSSFFSSHTSASLLHFLFWLTNFWHAYYL